MARPDLREAALGNVPPDLVVTGCSLVSVHTGEIIPDMQISICDGHIVYVGPDSAAGSDTHTLDVKGRHIVPGLADPHTHIDQFVLPHQTSACLLARGTTSVFSDPIDITGVTGYEGFSWFLDACRSVPLRVFHGVPGGLPVDPVLSHLDGLGDADMRRALREPDVFGMGEVFSWTKITRGDPTTLRRMDMVLREGGIINGHTAGMSGRRLAAYAAAGISSCHEPIDYDQVMERLRAGLYVMIREGSIRRDLRRIMEEVASRGTTTHRIMFCSDGLNPTDLQCGHMDRCVREAIGAGVEPVDAVAMASRNIFEYYNMDHMLGGLAPGRLADVVILDDLEKFAVNTVLVAGRQMPHHTVSPPVPDWLGQMVRLERLTRDDLAVKATGQTASANTIRLRTEIVTQRGDATVAVRDGEAVGANNTWKVAAFDRIHRTGNRAVGFLEGFGDGEGAMASTASFHENDLVILGSNDADMVLAANHLIESQGGMAVVRQGRLVASLPMPIAGLMSADDVSVVGERFEAVNGAARDMGCRFESPHLILLFLPFLALPHIRITNRGIVDIRRQEIIPAIQ